MDRHELITVIMDQHEYYKNIEYIPRLRNLSIGAGNEITVISGVRGCGKSTLLQEIRQQNKEADYFLNFDDERLIHFSVDDFQMLHEVFIELFGNQSTFYFDEIQNINGWERFVRRLYDTGNKVYVTGSNASMFSKELGTHLTGRYIQYELFPFSFSEYLEFHHVSFKKEDFFTTKGKSNLKKQFNEYLKWGGFPEYLKNKNRDYLKALYESILYRDVLVRNKLTTERELLELVYYLTGNISRLVSYNRLKNMIGVKNATTVKKYLKYLEDTYLIFLVNKFDYSIKKQIQNPKKVYLIDVGLAQELGFHSTEDKGHLLENVVYLELRRRRNEIYYMKNDFECDFVIRYKNRIVRAIQVAWTINKAETKGREINGLQKVMETFGLKEGYLLTEDTVEDIQISGGKTIKVRPVWQWLLDN